MFGCSACISPVLAILEQHLDRDGSAIDVGCGSGMWGHILRTYFRPLKVDGVDPVPEWTSPFYRQVDSQTVEEWLQMWPVIGTAQPQPYQPPYTLGLCLDVIEHLDRPTGETLLDRMAQIASNWFVSTPQILFDTNAPGYAQHKTLWTVQDFTSRGFRMIPIVDPRFSMLLAYRGVWL